LDHAKAYEEGSLLQLQASAVFCAFTFEAYLNHVGYEEVQYWDEIEKISYRSKLKVISAHLGVKIDESRRPFQTIIELFRLRDKLAHGRTLLFNEVDETSTLPSHDSSWRIMSWEKLETEDLERYLADLDAAVETINSARKSPDQLLWNQGERSRRVRAVKSGR
jgi:hypothetical protein